MSQLSPEDILILFIVPGLSLVAVLFILLAGKYVPAIGRIKERMLAHWKPAVLIVVVFIVSMRLGGNSWLNPYAIAVFCQAWIGLAIASSIFGFDALPVAHAITERKKIAVEFTLLFGIALAAAIYGIIIGSVGMSIGKNIFGEISYTQQAQSALPTTNKWLVFFSLLGGAGIAEETTYRLVILSLVWKLTNHKWLAIVVSALAFGAYHLSPLNQMYLIFWKFPISQFTASVLIALMNGYVFTKRGFGTTVLAHTLSDWLPFMLLR